MSCGKCSMPYSDDRHPHIFKYSPEREGLLGFAVMCEQCRKESTLLERVEMCIARHKSNEAFVASWPIEERSCFNHGDDALRQCLHSVLNEEAHCANANN